MQLPNELLQSLEGIKGFDKEAFIDVHESGEQVTSIRVNPYKSNVKSDPDSYRESNDIFRVSPFTSHEKIPWTDLGYYLKSRPSFTFDPLFHAGCYYVQEASSMFLEQALKQTVDLSRPLKVLDLCAAPGGKSTHLLSLISEDSLLVSNEVIRPRANILGDNIMKWGCSNVMITNNDPRDFQQLENYFDVIVIDAPCSGSGLFRREPDAIEEWSEQNVMLCSQRQQRILADVMPALKNAGILIYSTCSYSEEEDEQIIEWARNKLTINYEELIVDPGWNIVKSGGGYRFWPDKIRGEGFFVSCLRKGSGDDKKRLVPKVKSDKFSKQEIEILNNYISSNKIAFVKNEGAIHALPEQLVPDVNFLSSKLRVMSFGTRVGEMIKDKLIPEHSLALSNILSQDFPKLELSYDQAIQYLKKKDPGLQTEKKGWWLASYSDYPLGWVNILSNRINNYYPKELRILKD